MPNKLPLDPIMLQGLRNSLAKMKPVGIPGLIAPGNIDLYNRPQVVNPDGSISTVRSMSTNINGKEVLMPTVIGNRVVSDQEAIQHYLSTGQHLGIFSDPESATKYAIQLHNDYAAGKYDRKAK